MKLSRSSKAQSSATMPDWKPEIRRRLANLQLPPTREAAIVEELAQHLDESYAELLASGVSEAEALSPGAGGIARKRIAGARNCGAWSGGSRLNLSFSEQTGGQI